jgi:hypothetical protein
VAIRFFGPFYCVAQTFGVHEEKIIMSGRLVVKGIIGAALLLSVHGASAQLAGGGTKVPASTVSEFQSNPGRLLTQFPGAGPALVKQVRDLLGTDKATLPSIIGLLKLASPEQQIAIADALAQVAKAYSKSDPAFANQIQQEVANAGIPEVSKAYAEAAGDTGTASTGGGGGGAGGGQVGAPPTGGQNGGTFTNANPVNTTPNTIAGGGLGGTSDITSTTSTTSVVNNTTTNTPVSPN